MLRLIMKFFGVIFMVLALITAVLDLTRSIANSDVTVTALGQSWFEFHKESLLLLQPAITRYVHSYLWDPVMQTILLQPSWLVFFVLSLIFLWMGRRHKRHWQTRFGK